MMSQVEQYFALAPIKRRNWKHYLYDVLIALTVPLLATFIIYKLPLSTSLLIVLLVYTPVVLVLASFRGLWAALISSLVAFVAFGLFVIPFTSNISSFSLEKRVIFLFGLLVVGLLGTLYSVLRGREQQAKRQTLEMRMLYKLMKDIDIEENLAVQLQIIATAIVDVFHLWGVRECSFLEKDANGGLLLRAKAPESACLKHHLPDEESAILQAMSHGDPLILHNTSPISSSLGNARIHVIVANTKKGRAASRFVYIVPLKRGQHVLGGLRLVIEGDPRPFEENKPQTAFFRAFLDQAMSVIERTHLHDEKLRAETWQHTDELRKSLIDSVSHDLRTPLSSIKIAADTVYQIGARQKDELLQNHALSIQKEADRLHRFITNLLDISSIEGKALRLEKVLLPIDELIYNVQEHMQPLVQSRLQIHLPDGLPPVKIEPTRIDQVLTNILENAVRYTPAKSPIEITVEIVDQEMLVSVADRGPGISEANRELIFDKFYRIKKRQYNRTLPAGSGLGLAICRGIIEAHGGRIWADNREGGGAIFFFTLPLPSLEVKLHAQEGLIHSYS